MCEIFGVHGSYNQPAFNIYDCSELLYYTPNESSDCGSVEYIELQPAEGPRTEWSYF